MTPECLCRASAEHCPVHTQADYDDAAKGRATPDLNLDLDAIRARDAEWVPPCAYDDVPPWGEACDLPESLHGPDQPEWVACEKRRPEHLFVYPAESSEAAVRALIARLRAAEAEVKRLRLVVDGELGRWDVRAIAARREAERLRDIAEDAIEGVPT